MRGRIHRQEILEIVVSPYLVAIDKVLNGELIEPPQSDVRQQR